MPITWFSDDNYSNFFLRNLDFESYQKIPISSFSRELIEFFKNNGLVVFTSPNFSGLIRLFSENNYGIVEVLTELSINLRLYKKETVTKTICFGIGLMVNFLRTNLINLCKNQKTKNFPPFLYYIEKKIKNKVQKKFNLRLDSFCNFSLLVLGKAILSETFDKFFNLNPSCYWWNIRWIFSIKKLKNTPNQKNILAAVNCFLLLNPELFGFKKNKKGNKNFTKYRKSWTLGLYDYFLTYTLYLISEIVNICDFFLEKKKALYLRQIFIYSKITLGYTGLSGGVDPLKNPSVSKLSFSPVAAHRISCIGEVEKRKSESTLTKNKEKKIIKEIETQKHRVITFSPKGFERRVFRFLEIFQLFKPNKIFLSNFPKFISNSFLLSNSKIINDTMSMIKNFTAFTLTEDNGEPVGNFFLNGIVCSELPSELFFQFYSTTYFSSDFLEKFLKNTPLEILGAQMEILSENLLSRKKKNLYYGNLLFQTLYYSLFFLPKDKSLIPGVNTEIKGFNFKRQLIRIQLQLPFLEYLFEKNNSKNFGNSLRKKYEYTKYKNIKTPLYNIGEASDNGKYHETVYNLIPTCTSGSKYYLSAWFYKKKKFFFSKTQLSYFLNEHPSNNPAWLLSAHTSSFLKNFSESTCSFLKVFVYQPCNKKVLKNLIFLFPRISNRKKELFFAIEKLILNKKIPLNFFRPIIIYSIETEGYILSSILKIVKKFFIQTYFYLKVGNFFFSKIFNILIEAFGKKTHTSFFLGKNSINLFIDLYFRFSEKLLFLSSFYLCHKKKHSGKNLLVGVLIRKTIFIKIEGGVGKNRIKKLQKRNNETEHINRMLIFLNI